VHRSKTRAKNSRVIGIFILTSQGQTLVRAPDAMRVERRPVDVIVAAVNALKVKSCWHDAPDAN